MKTIYLVCAGKDMLAAFVDKGDAQRYVEWLAGNWAIIEDVELYARNEWNPHPTLEENNT